MKRLLLKIHHSIPPEIRKYYRFLGLTAEYLKKFYLPVYTSSCRERVSGKPIRVIHIGWDRKLMHYWLGRFSDDPGNVTRQKRIIRWRIQGFLDRVKEQADIAFVEHPGTADPGLNYGFLLPVWMEMVIDLDQSVSKSRMRNILRNINRYGLNFELRKELSDFELFYHQMYVPFSQRRHGASAEIADYKHFAGKFRNESPLLFFIISDQKSVAGAYVENKGDHHRLSAFGILDGNQEYYNKGVLGALYYFIIHYFKDKGEEKLLAGNSRPVLLDGVSEYKRQLGAAPYMKDLKGRKRYRFVLLKQSNPVINILKNNPLYIINEQVLQIVLFLDEQDYENKDQFLKFFKRLHSDQVAKIHVYYLGPSKNMCNWVKEEGMDNTYIAGADLILPTIV